MRKENWNINYERLFKTMFYSIFFTLIIFCLSCKKLVEVKAPVTSLTSDNVYNNEATASEVLIGLYTKLAYYSPLNGNTISSISIDCGLASDELTLFGGSSNLNTTLAQYYTNKLNSGSPTQVSGSIWNESYSYIYTVNLAIEKISNSTKLSVSAKSQLLGESKFLRAFFYLYLVNLYGDIPLTTSSDYRVNSRLSRSPASDVYKQIIADLQDAQTLLNDNYVGADITKVSQERLRPNKWAATALLARVYLFAGDWTNAELEATKVINANDKYKLTSLNGVFLKNSAEAIWQLQPVNTGWNTEDARVFILPSTGPTSNSSVSGYPIYLSNQLLNAFESNDQRKTNWVYNVTVSNGSTSSTYYYPFKYKSATLNDPISEYTMVLRLGEQYLIRAEARAHLDNSLGAVSDLDSLRSRAGLAAYNGSTIQAPLLAAILHERQVELFSEWGHRWFDLKRTGNIDAVISNYAQQKGTIWASNWALFPIPLYEIIQNPNLKQNLGY